MYTNSVQLVGNLVDAPDVQVTNSGVVRARFRIASTERRRDPSSETWSDGESVFLDVTCWRRLAQHVGNSLIKGDRVVVLGRLRQWTAERDGVRRTMLEVEADVVGPDLQRGMATIARPRRTDATGAQPDAVVDPETGEILVASGDGSPVEAPAESLAGALTEGDRAGGDPRDGEPADGLGLEDVSLPQVLDARPLVDTAV